MIEYTLLGFADEAAAISDAVVGAYYVSDGSGGNVWLPKCCIPSVTVTTISTGQAVSGWGITIASDSDTPELRQHAKCSFYIDWSVPQTALVDQAIDPADCQKSPSFTGYDYFPAPSGMSFLQTSGGLDMLDAGNNNIEVSIV